MKYLLFVLSFNVVLVSIYFGIFYGLHVPTKTRYTELICVRINDTFSKSVINCQKIIFNKSLEGVCFYDKLYETIVKFDTEWINLVIITGAIASFSILFFICILLSIFYKKTILKRFII